MYGSKKGVKGGGARGVDGGLISGFLQLGTEDRVGGEGGRGECVRCVEYRIGCR